MELFPLFPTVTARWADQLPCKQYWGLHPPLSPLDSLLAHEAQQQARTLLEQEAMQSIAEYLLQVDSLSPPLTLFTGFLNNVDSNASGFCVDQGNVCSCFLYAGQVCKIRHDNRGLT